MPSPRPLSPTPLSDLRVSRHQIPRHNLIPNTSLQHRPLLVYHSAFPDAPSPPAIESHLQSVGAVVPRWRYTMYTTPHFHTTTHEVLCVSAGRARLCFGGGGNEGRVEEVLGAGDVVVVPAGVAHHLLEDMSGGGFQMVGSYPVDAETWDMCYGEPGEEDKVEGIKKLAWFTRDPIYGDEGPTLE
ncbi:hypothetical protein ACRE_053130 [Hapsidospora chrysogenum ATCC 11550]|uniref:Cupin type-1 domain-containing protein n=1 Tax=Hapsidospora chrysogenum (strain ATCC 11550 / CBS 779.69 / DSM 880 / IAM 14645 / JCM 23072 / IMI 49137) TaxID=857340 RepID=A0A086T3I4_HAPC1|nr:hypothetical protein ACRE_053130 [Hapsidospora chrysogenum ATCC 11550]